MRFKIHSVIPCIYKRDYSQSLCLFVSLSFCHFVCLSRCLSVSLSLSFFLCLSLSLCFSLSLYLCLSVLTVIGGFGERGRGEKGRGAKVLDIHRPSDEAGPRGAFAPKKLELKLRRRTRNTGCSKVYVQTSYVY